MRVLLQRVRAGSVTVDGGVTGSINVGFVALVGVTHDDTQAEAEKLAKKTANLRVFSDSAGKMNLSLLDVAGGVLVVSQFTLYADARKGRRPSYIGAAPPEIAEPLVRHFAECLAREGVRQVEHGVFGALMQSRSTMTAGDDHAGQRSTLIRADIPIESLKKQKRATHLDRPRYLFSLCLSCVTRHPIRAGAAAWAIPRRDARKRRCRFCPLPERHAGGPAHSECRT